MQPAPPVSQPPERLWSLDAFRGLSAFVVFLTHWHLWANLPPQGTLERFTRSYADTIYDWFVTLAWPTGGHHPAVICFFVLSGFCIHYPFALRAQRGERPDWRGYLHRRFSRIMPIYWLATAGGLIFVAAQTWRPSGNELLQFHAAITPLGVVVRLLGLEGFYPDEIVAGNYILITVASEMVMYVVYPLIHGWATRNAWVPLGAGFIGLNLLGLFLLRFVTPYWVFNSILMLGIFWYLGAFAAQRFVQGRASLRPVWLLVAWGVFLGLKAIPHFYGLNLIKQLAWGIVCLCAILTVLHTQGRHSTWPGHFVVRALRYLGGISYSLYALHTPAIMFATWLLVSFYPPGGYFLQLALSLGLTGLVVVAAHYGIERRFYPQVATAMRR